VRKGRRNDEKGDQEKGKNGDSRTAGVVEMMTLRPKYLDLHCDPP
jgi:hypothetical protein